jgi:hypothetical protein
LGTWCTILIYFYTHQVYPASPISPVVVKHVKGTVKRGAIRGEWGGGMYLVKGEAGRGLHCPLGKLMLLQKLVF